jgi:glucose/arabinose dehydrogenase
MPSAFAPAVAGRRRYTFQDAVPSGLRAALLLLPLGIAACGDTAQLPMARSVGPDPALPPPVESAMPTVKIAPAVGWPIDDKTGRGKPIAAADLMVEAYARNLDHPRWLYVLPNGDVLVAETNAPARPEDNTGVKGWIAGLVMSRAGAGTPSANRITLLRGLNKDGSAKVRTTFLGGLNSPFGMALVGDTFYVADTDAILRFPYVPGETSITAKGTKVADLPAGPINHHWTKNLIASRDGSKLYVTVGSNSNVAENGIAQEKNRAAILEVDPATGQSRVFASGLRNPNGLGWEPETGVLWTVVNERDELGSDLVPDYLTSVKEGAFYGWPYSYYGQHVDTRVQPPDPALVKMAIKPDYALGNHVAALGLAFAQGDLLPDVYRQGAFIGRHGSWNRDPFSGYDVVFVPFRNGRPSGQPVEVLTGFLTSNGEAQGRPVGVALDRSGALLVADDVGNTVWRVTPAPLAKLAQ